MGEDSANSNPGTSDALNAGIAENLMGTGDATVPLDEQDLAVPIYQPKGRRAAASFIFLTIALDMLALGMIAPVLPRLIASFMAGNVSGSARMLGIFGTVFAIMQFFFSPVLGSLSDRFGRRPVVLLSNFGLGLDYLLMAWAPALGWLFVGRVISGLTASSVPTGMAYMTDVTPPEKRASAFGLVGAAFGMGFVLGPALGGILGSVNPRLPFLVAGCLSLLNGLYGIFVLPESLSHQHRSPFSWKRANPVGSLRMLKNNKVLFGLSAVLVLGYLAQQSLQNVYVLMADYRYGWSDRTVGWSLALVAIFAGFYSAGLVKPLVKRSASAARSPSASSAAPSATPCSASPRPASSCFGAFPCSTSWPSPGPPRSPSCRARSSPPSRGRCRAACRACAAWPRSSARSCSPSSSRKPLARVRPSRLPARRSTSPPRC